MLRGRVKENSLYFMHLPEKPKTIWKTVIWRSGDKARATTAGRFGSNHG